MDAANFSSFLALYLLLTCSEVLRLPPTEEREKKKSVFFFFFVVRQISEALLLFPWLKKAHWTLFFFLFSVRHFSFFLLPRN